MKLKSGVTVVKGAYVDAVAKDVARDVVTVYKEVGGTRLINVPEKKIVKQGGGRTPVLITLRIPKGAQVNHMPPTGDVHIKARANRALVVSIVDKQGNVYKEAYASHDTSFKYTVGKVAKAKGFKARAGTCSAGIHFYRTPYNAWRWVGA